MNLREMYEKATGGEWVVRRPNGRSSVWTKTGCKIASVEAPDCVPAFMETRRAANAALIVALHNLAPELLAVREAALEAIRTVEPPGTPLIAFRELRAALAALREKEGKL